MILNIHQIVPVVFDAKNPAHRAAYQQFIKDGSWKNVPFRFFLAETGNSLPEQLSRAMLDFYMSNDTALKNPKTVLFTEVKVKQKRKPRVAKIVSVKASANA